MEMNRERGPLLDEHTLALFLTALRLLGKQAKPELVELEFERQLEIVQQHRRKQKS